MVPARKKHLIESIVKWVGIIATGACSVVAGTAYVEDRMEKAVSRGIDNVRKTSEENRNDIAELTGKFYREKKLRATNTARISLGQNLFENFIDHYNKINGTNFIKPSELLKNQEE